MRLVFLLMLVHNLVAQDIDFMKHLINNELLGEAKTLNKEWHLSETVSQDAAYYWLGRIHEKEKSWHQAAKAYLGVSQQSFYFIESHYMGVHALLRDEHYNRASNQLFSVTFSDSLDYKFNTYMQTGVSLLMRNHQRYDSLTNILGTPLYYFETEQAELDTYQQDVLSFKAKKPLLASFMSVILPGTGKMYAGNTGTGISNLAQVLFFSALAYEGYRRNGPQSFRFIFFTSVAGIFHVSQAVGSYYAVKKYNYDFNHAVDSRIVVNLYIPLFTRFRN